MSREEYGPEESDLPVRSAPEVEIFNPILEIDALT
jgi:hypothetical protein